jgi:methyl-accepting chemotaxis protein
VSVAERSGELISELVPVVRKTADLVQGFHAASAEQSNGVSQVPKAMGTVDEQQRNASAAEEPSSTAEDVVAGRVAARQVMAFIALSEWVKATLAAVSADVAKPEGAVRWEQAPRPPLPAPSPRGPGG